MTQHRTEQASAPCKCGAVAIVTHVSWQCPIYQADRQPFLDIYRQDLASLPVRTQYAGIPPQSLHMSLELAKTMHLCLVSILPANVDARTEQGLVPRVGNPGGFCRSVANLWPGQNLKFHPRHVRRETHQRRSGFRARDGTLAKHDLKQWNISLNTTMEGTSCRGIKRLEKVIRSPDERHLACNQPNRKRRWKDRVNNLPRTVCAWQAMEQKFRIRTNTLLHSFLTRGRPPSAAVLLPMPFLACWVMRPPEASPEVSAAVCTHEHRLRLWDQGVYPTTSVIGNLPPFYGGLVLGNPFLYHRSGFQFPPTTGRNLRPGLASERRLRLRLRAAGAERCSHLANERVWEWLARWFGAGWFSHSSSTRNQCSLL